MDKHLFECKIAVQRETEGGNIKSVTELYLVDADSFTEAEARINKEFETIPEFVVKTIKKSDIDEIVPTEGETYYKAKVAFITIDEKTNTEKAKTFTYLCLADNFLGAYNNIVDYMKQSVTDWEIACLARVDILEYFKR